MKRLIDLRRDINRIDEDMMKLFVKRFTIVKEIGLVKKQKKLPIYDPAREKEILERQKKLLDNDEMWPIYEKIYRLIIELSKEAQK